MTPASGYRWSASGDLGVMGTNGYSWSSSPAAASSLRAANLYFNSSNMYPEDSSSHGRAVGFPVRCVAE